MLMDAIRRVVYASASIAIYALIVDAKNENARKLYERYGFLSLCGKQLFLPITDHQETRYLAKQDAAGIFLHSKLPRFRMSSHAPELLQFEPGKSCELGMIEMSANL